MLTTSVDSSMAVTPTVFYLCDGEACRECSDECNHTSDITHAVNFKPTGVDGLYFESEVDDGG